MNYPLRIETARLYTRALTLQDAEAWTHFLENAEATQYFPKLPVTPAERAEIWIESQLKRYSEGSYGLLALIDKESGAWIGQCGLLGQQVDGTAELEVGYHIFPEFWLQGYATEAARAFRDLGFQHNLAPSIVSIIHRENIGSQAVATNNGMKREKACEFKDMEVFVYRIWRAEWEKLQE
ncbi:MAG: GNAT family N-acetyltransferase [Bacteroidetes bacterium]|nr:GNAT family N-acetyltransferase [Bacteroidota bacterium]